MTATGGTGPGDGWVAPSIFLFLIGALVLLLGVLVGALVTARSYSVSNGSKCSEVTCEPTKPQPPDFKGMTEGQVISTPCPGRPTPTPALIRLWQDQGPRTVMDPQDVLLRSVRALPDGKYVIDRITSDGYFITEVVGIGATPWAATPPAPAATFDVKVDFRTTPNPPCP